MSLPAAVLSLVILAAAGCQAARTGGGGGPAGAVPPPAAPSSSPAQGLTIEDLLIGDGAIAERGQRVTVHYVGRLSDGTVFDSTVERNLPATFALRRDVVIAGWVEGIRGMRVGGRRRLMIPPAMGYGYAGIPGIIPPNATLVFEVELLDVR